MEPLGGQSTINSVSLAGDSSTLLPLDTIQEFSTQQNPKAEFGWKPGSITSIALKSGTNAYHGTASAYGRTDITDARNAFSHYRSCYRQGAEAGRFRVGRTSRGGTFCGPIKRTSCTFFAGFEGQTYTVGNPASFTFPGVSDAIGACNSNITSGAGNSATSLKMAGLNANCTRNSGYSIFDLGSSFAAVPGTTQVVGNLNTGYAVYGGMGKIDYNLNDKNTINAKYFNGTHTGTVVNSQTITQPLLATHRLRRRAVLRRTMELHRQFLALQHASRGLQSLLSDV